MKNRILYRYFLLMVLINSQCLKAQVVINEVHMRPAGSSTGSNPQNLVDCSPQSGAEFIELYNSSPCSQVDISCYIIATNIAGTSATSHGAFRFPAGTIIPPLGFVSIGGINSGATFTLNTYCGTANLAIDPSGRWYMPNGDGYMMLYNSTGTAIDAVYWTTDGDASKWGTDSDINTNPTRIPAGTGGCAVVASLSGPANLPISAAEHIGIASGAGFSSSRQTDGSLTWIVNSPKTINACNGACAVSNAFSITSTVVQPTCGNSNGSITITPNPAGTYTYIWSPNVSSTNSATGLAPNTYSINIKDINGCEKDTSITLSSAPPFVVTSIVTQPTCVNPLGSITLTPNPAAAYTYTWTPNVSTTNSATNLAVGGYQIHVSNGTCSLDTTITLNAATGCGCVNPFTLSGDSTANTVCNGSSTPCNYSGPNIVFNEIRVNPGTATNSIGTVAGTANGREFIELYNPNPCNAMDLSCYIIAGNNNNDNKSHWALRFPAGTIVAPLGFLTIAGDSVPGADIYPKNFVTTGAWDNVNFKCADPAAAWLMNGSDWKAIYEPNGTPVAGLAWSFSIDNISYINTSSNYNAVPTVINNASCPTASSLASIRTMYNSGTVPVDFLSGIGTGVWYRATDGTGAWTFSSNVNATTVSACNSTCATPQPGGSSSCNGTAMANITSGGTGPFSYQWNDPLNQTTATADSLCPGTYCVTVTDITGLCVENICVEVLDESSIDFTSIVSQPTCANNDGSITVTPANVGTYTYSWTPNASTTNSAINLAAGSYLIEASDGACTWDTTITLNSAAPFTVSSTVVAPSCANNDGSISLTPNLAGTYTYTWVPNVSTSSSINTLASGSYFITVNNGSCSWDTTITLNSAAPFSVASTVVAPSCANNDGSISLTPNLAGTYTYSWVPNVSTSSSINTLASGSYFITVNNGSCSWDTTITLNSAAPFTVSSTVVAPSCANNDGSISLTPNLAGTYTYSWVPNVSTSSSINTLASGSYFITVNNGSCSWDTSITLNSAAPFTVASTVVAPSCANNDGSISLTPNIAGTYTYSWTPNVSTSSSINTLASGSYFITVNNGSCSWDTSITLNSAAPFTVTSSVNQPTCGLNNGSISLSTSLPDTYSYVWLPNVSTSNVGSNLVSGSYHITVSNGNCSFDTTINLTNSGTIPLANFNYLITDSTCFLAGTTTNLSTGAINYSWSIDDESYSQNPTINFQFDDDQIHTISLLATSIDGCKDVKNIIINYDFIDAPVFVPNVFTPSNTDGMNDTWYVLGECVEEFECLIFNRWGNKLYTMTNINDKWDGTYKGKDVPQGVYVYVLTVKKNFSRKIIKHGHITKL